MSKTLLTILGKSNGDRKTGYRTATYRFPEGKEETTPFFGLALANHLQPDILVILGTAGSMWGVLVENFMHDAEQEDLRMELLAAEEAGQVTQHLLDRITPLLQQSLAHTLVLRLIPSGREREDQIGILEVIHDTVGKKPAEIHLDITHGFRHLAIVGFLSAAMLERLHSQLTIQGLWYGALDMTKDNATPVIRLDGLHAVQQWVSALDRFDASGNYSVFAPLLVADGLPKSKAKCLIDAAHFEMTTQIPFAARSLCTLLPDLDTILSGASALFQEQLRKRLQWAKIENLAEQQRLLAKRALDRNDYLRAAILGLEAFISRRVQDVGGDPRDYPTRKDAAERLESDLKERLHPDWLRDAYWNTKNLRNSMAHGSWPTYENLQRLLKNRDALRDELERNLGRLTTAQPNR